MAAGFPGTIYSSTSPASKRNTILTQQEWIDAIDELAATQTNLGVNPHGTYATVRARLDGVEATQTALGTVGYRGLFVRNDSGTPNDVVTATFDALSVDGTVVKGTPGSPVTLSGNITVAGAGGLDTGSQANSTWYYIFVIYNPTTGGSTLLLSVSSHSPTMPSGYTKKRRVGAVRNNSSGNFVRFRQTDSYVSIANEAHRFNSGAAPGSAAWKTQSLAAPAGLGGGLPPTSRMADLLCILDTATANRGLGIRFSDDGGNGQFPIFAKPSAPQQMRVGVRQATDASQQIQWSIVDNTPSLLNEAGVSIDVLGYLESI